MVAAQSGIQQAADRKADHHRRLAEVFDAAADLSHTPEDRALLAEKAARFRALARMAERKATTRLLN